MLQNQIDDNKKAESGVLSSGSKTTKMTQRNMDLFEIGPESPDNSNYVNLSEFKSLDFSFNKDSENDKKDKLINDEFLKVIENQ